MRCSIRSLGIMLLDSFIQALMVTPYPSRVPHEAVDPVNARKVWIFT